MRLGLPKTFSVTIRVRVRVSDRKLGLLATCSRLTLTLTLVLTLTGTLAATLTSSEEKYFQGNQTLFRMQERSRNVPGLQKNFILEK